MRRTRCVWTRAYWSGNEVLPSGLVRPDTAQGAHAVHDAVGAGGVSAVWHAGFGADGVRRSRQQRARRQSVDHDVEAGPGDPAAVEPRVADRGGARCGGGHLRQLVRRDLPGSQEFLREHGGRCELFHRAGCGGVAGRPAAGVPEHARCRGRGRGAGQALRLEDRRPDPLTGDHLAKKGRQQRMGPQAGRHLPCQRCRAAGHRKQHVLPLEVLRRGSPFRQRGRRLVPGENRGPG